MSEFKFLNTINFPSDIKKLTNSDLKILSASDLNDAAKKIVEAIG